jgi:hypothetical protein
MPSADTEVGWQRHGATCICRRCRNLRKRQAWRPAPVEERVYSDEASAHIRQLVRMGWKQTEIAAAAGVSTGAVSTAKERGVRILASTAEKILAVNPTGSRR